MLKKRIEQDLKTAMLGGDKQTVATLRGLKSVILYAEVAKGSRDEGLGDDEVTALLVKEAKKRQESADLYVKGGSSERADSELAEKAIIENYLPKQLSDEELRNVIEGIVGSEPETSMQNIGQVIGKVKQETQGAADGARIAQFVKERLN